MAPRKIRINNRCDPLRFDAEKVERWLSALDGKDTFPIPAGDLSVVFLADSEMGELHGTFLGDPSPTDVITFPGDPSFDEAGEICVGAQQARRVYERHESTLSDEILLYLAHGWLHLAGYDDLTDEDRRTMRCMEAKALRQANGRAEKPRFEWVD